MLHPPNGCCFILITPAFFCCYIVVRVTEKTLNRNGLMRPTHNWTGVCMYVCMYVHVYVWQKVKMNMIWLQTKLGDFILIK